MSGAGRPADQGHRGHGRTARQPPPISEPPANAPDLVDHKETDQQYRADQSPNEEPADIDGRTHVLK